MLKVKGNNLYLTRGDTAFLKIELTDNKGERYEMKDGDALYFRMKRSTTSRDILVEKQIADGALQINESDTKDLDFGMCRYEVELVMAEGHHYTVIENASFEIGPELENHTSGGGEQ